MAFLLRTGLAIAFLLAPAATAFAEDAAAGIPVPKRPIYPGDVITEDMLASKPAGQVKGAGALVTDAENLIGKTARRTLLPGQFIPKVAIREAYVVLQGKTVAVVFHSGTVTITGVGQALQSGSAGEMIAARNPDSGLVIRGIVQPDGSLRAD